MADSDHAATTDTVAVYAGDSVGIGSCNRCPAVPGRAQYCRVYEFSLGVQTLRLCRPCFNALIRGLRRAAGHGHK